MAAGHQQDSPQQPQPRQLGRRARKILANTGFLYVRMLLVLAVSLYTSRIILRELGVVDYGIYSVVGGFVALVGFLAAALSQTTQRFLAFEMAKEDGQIRSVFTTAIAIHGALALIVLVVGHFAGQWAISSLLNFPVERTDAVFGAFYFALFSFCVSIIQVPFHSMIVAQERMHVFAGVSVVETVLKLGIAVSIPFALVDRLIHFTGLLFVLSTVVLALYAAFCWSTYRACRGYRAMIPSIAFALVGQVGWNLWGNIAAVLGTQGVNVLLNVFFGPAVNAAQGLATQVRSAVSMFIVNVQTAVNPQITKTYAGGEVDHFNRLVFLGAKLYSFIYLVTALPVILEAEYLLELWLDVPPPHTAAFTQIVLATFFANALSGTLFTAAQASGRVRAYNAILGTVSLVNIPLSWFVLRAGASPESALLVALTLSVAMVPIRVALVARVAGISGAGFFRNVMVPIGAVSVVVVGIGMVSVNTLAPSFLRLMLTVSATVFAVLASAYMFGLDSSERGIVAAAVNALRSRVAGRGNGIAGGSQ